MKSAFKFMGNVMSFNIKKYRRLKMVPKIKRLLFTTDLSENARYAFNYAADMAARNSAGIVILHVLEDIPFNAESALVNMLGEKEYEELKKQHENEAANDLIGKRSENKLIRNALRNLSRQTEDKSQYDADDNIEIIVKSGNVVEEIIVESEENDCGMIVMAYRSRNMLAETIVGGVCRKVLKRTQKPVLLVPMPDKS
jgi:nucleotide-binding universal stress UspA family protein